MPQPCAGRAGEERCRSGGGPSPSWSRPSSGKAEAGQPASAACPGPSPAGAGCRSRERGAGARARRGGVGRGGGRGRRGCPRRTTAPGVLGGGRGLRVPSCPRVRPGTAPSGSRPPLWATRRRYGAALARQRCRWCCSSRRLLPPPRTRPAPAALVRPAARGSSCVPPRPGPSRGSVSPKAVRAGGATELRAQARGRALPSPARGFGRSEAAEFARGSVKPPPRGSARSLRSTQGRSRGARQAVREAA